MICDYMENVSRKSERFEEELSSEENSKWHDNTFDRSVVLKLCQTRLTYAATLLLALCAFNGIFMEMSFQIEPHLRRNQSDISLFIAHWMARWHDALSQMAESISNQSLFIISQSIDTLEHSKYQAFLIPDNIENDCHNMPDDT